MDEEMTDLAAALLRDVPRYTYLSDYGHLEQFMEEADVLAALFAHLDAAIAEQAGEMAKRLDAVSLDVGYSSTTTLDSGVVRQAADLITALIAQLAALRAEVRKSAMDAVSAGCQAQEAWEAQKAAEAERDALRAERDDALTFLDNAVSKSPEPLKALGKYLAGRLDEDEWPTAEQYLNAAAKACADRAEAAETALAAERAKVAKLVEALKEISDTHNEQWHAGRIARAALSATTEEGHE